MKLAFIGLGTMGSRMAANLQRAGHEVRAHDLRKEEGFNWFAAAPDAVQGCEIVFTSVPGPDDVDAVAAKLKPVLRSGTAWFDLSTNSPSRVRRLHAELAQQGVQFLDAPVSGGPSGAQSGKLAIWVGGDRPTYERCESVLRAFGDQPLYIGAIGAGTVAKLAHNCGSFAIHAAMAEVFTLGVKAGVDPLSLFRALRQGASGRRRTFDRLADNFLPGKYDPAAFSLRLAHKDARLGLELAREVGVPMQIGQVMLDELTRAIERGWIDRDFRVAMTLQEERAGVDVHVAPEKLRAALDE